MAFAGLLHNTGQTNSYGLGSSVQDKTGRGLSIRSRSMRDGQVENPNQGGYGLEGWSTSESE